MRERGCGEMVRCGMNLVGTGEGKVDGEGVRWLSWWLWGM